MKIRSELKVREMAEEQVVIMPGRTGVDMTKVLSLNPTSLYLWDTLQGQDFESDDIAQLLVDKYQIDLTTAQADAKAWVERLQECGVLI